MSGAMLDIVGGGVGVEGRTHGDVLRLLKELLRHPEEVEPISPPSLPPDEPVLQ